MSKHYTISIDQGTRVLKDDELDSVNGGFRGPPTTTAAAQGRGMIQC